MNLEWRPIQYGEKLCVDGKPFGTAFKHHEGNASARFRDYPFDAEVKFHKSVDAAKEYLENFARENQA